MSGLEKSHLTRRSLIHGMAGAGLIGLAGAPLVLPQAARATPASGGNLVFGIAGANTTDSLDPGLIWDDFMMLLSYGGLRNNLVELDAEGIPQPELAESWETSADAKTWVFKLRQGVEFHNGKSLTTEDVIASINHHRGDKSTSLVSSVFNQIEDIVAEDNRTLRFTLVGGNADFAVLMSDYHLSIMPANPDGSVDWQSGLGTGGYVLDKFKAGERADTTRFINYWKEGRAHVDAITLLAINDPVARQSALLTGEVDVIDRVELKTLSFFEREEKVRILEVEGYQHASIPMNTAISPFDQKHTRLALKYGINRQQMVDTILMGRGSIGNDHPIPASQKYFNDELEQREYDPERAKFHLRKAGMEGLDVKLHAADAAFTGAVDAALLFSESAKAAGMNIQVVREPNDGYWSDVWAKVPLCMSIWFGQPTPDAMFSLVYAEDASFGDTNWKNKRFNELLVTARAELDTDKRAQMYGEMQMLTNEDGGVVVPMFMNYVHGLSHKVGTPEKIGRGLRLDGMKAMERWWVDS